MEACCWGTLWGNDINTLFPEKTPRFGAHCQNEVPIELRRAEISVEKIFFSIANNKKDPQKILYLYLVTSKNSQCWPIFWGKSSLYLPVFDLLSIWGQNPVAERLCRFLVKPPHFTNKNDKHKPEKWETFFDAIFSESKIGNKFWPPKSSMGTLLPLGSSKNRSFFGKECRIPRIWVPQQHHLSQQHFGGHVA